MCSPLPEGWQVLEVVAQDGGQRVRLTPKDDSLFGWPMIILLASTQVHASRALALSSATAKKFCYLSSGCIRTGEGELYERLEKIF